MWTTHVEKEAEQSSHMTHNHLPYQGPKPLKKIKKCMLHAAGYFFPEIHGLLSL